MSLGDVVTTEVIAIFGVLLLIATIIPGVRLYWPRHDDPASRSDLGVALMGGALIAFAVLALQLMIQIRAQFDANDRQQEADRQALLLLLGRSPDLSGLDLEEEDLNDAYLNSKVLRGANLVGAEMNNASLQDANLVAAHLKGAELKEARLDRADLRYADLRGAKLTDASLSSAKLDGAALAPAWDGDELVGVDLSGANLSNTWARADFRRAKLVGTSLVGARLAPANLQRSNLRGADLEFADLRGANLIAADLAGAINLDKAKDLSYVKHNRDTKWPKGFLWEEEDPLKCARLRPVCRLHRKSKRVNDFPPELIAMRQELATATTPKKRCLTGWLVDERPTAIEVHAPGDRAVFEVGTARVGNKTAKNWAESFGNRNVTPIPAIRANGASSTYAERFKINIAGRPLERVTVYFVDGSRGFSFAGTAPRDLFDLFQRDFLKLFRAVGINGDVFPELRGDKAGCAT